MPIDLTPSDLAPFADIPPDKANEMIRGAVARASQFAPCLDDDAFPYGEAARDIIRDVVLRRHESGAGAVTTTADATGPYSHSQTVDTRQFGARGLYRPSEITELQALCARWRRDSGAVAVVDSAVPKGAFPVVLRYPCT